MERASDANATAQRLPGCARRTIRLHVLGALLAAALFSCESWVFGPDSWIYGYGGALETIPTYKALAQHGCNFSVWAPFVACGAPRMAFWGNADPVSPELLLFAILPTWMAFGLHRFLQYFVAVFFASRLFDEQFRVGGKWALLGGWLHGAFCFMTTGELFTHACVPLVLWLLPYILSADRSCLRAIGAGILISLCTTFTFGVPYLLLFAGIWMLAVMREYSRPALLRFFLFGAVLILVESPQAFAAASIAPFSNRSGWPGEQMAWSFDGLFYYKLRFDLFHQDFTLQRLAFHLPLWTSLLSALVTAVAAWLCPSLRRFCAKSGAVLGVYALLSQKWLWLSVQALVGAALPWVKGVYMGRFYEVPGALLIAFLFLNVAYLLWRLYPLLGTARVPALEFAVAYIAFLLLACQGWPWPSYLACELLLLTFLIWRRRPRVAPLRLASVVWCGALIAALIVWPKAAMFHTLGIDDWGEKHFQVQAVEQLKQGNREPIRVASVLPLQPTFAYAQGLECADGWANLFSGRYRELWLRVNAPLYSRRPNVREIFDPEGKKPQDVYVFLGADLIDPDFGLLPDEDLEECLREGFDVDARFNLDLLRLLSVEYLLSEYPLRGEGIELEYAPEHPLEPQVKDWATGRVLHPKAPISGAEVVRHHPKDLIREHRRAQKNKACGKDVYVYRLTGAAPRFRYVRGVIQEPNGNAVLDRIESMGMAKLRDCAVVEAGDVGEASRLESLGAGDVQLLNYGADEIELEVNNEQAGLLIAAMTWDPGWVAEADGEPRAVMRVNHAQLAVATEPHDKRIRLAYRPRYSLQPAVEFARENASFSAGVFGAFAVYVALHFCAYSLALRRRPEFLREKVIFLYHFVPAATLAFTGFAFVALCASWHVAATVTLIIAIHGIYSLTFLELWALADGSYSLRILSRIAVPQSQAKLNMQDLVQLGAEKTRSRLDGLQRLKLITQSEGRYRLTWRGRIVAACLQAFAAVAVRNAG